MDHLNLEQYAKILLIDRPFVYPESSVPKLIQSISPNLINLIDNKNSVSATSNVLKFKSLGGLDLTKFAKSKSLVVSFYPLVA